MRKLVFCVFSLCLVPVVPSVASAGWGDDTWGEMVSQAACHDGASSVTVISGVE